MSLNVIVPPFPAAPPVVGRVCAGNPWKNIADCHRYICWARFQKNPSDESHHDILRRAPAPAKRRGPLLLHDTIRAPTGLIECRLKEQPLNSQIVFTTFTTFYNIYNPQQRETKIRKNTSKCIKPQKCSPLARARFSSGDLNSATSTNI